MSKGKLQYFKERYEDEKEISRYAGITITENEMKWLIEQAERMEELKKELHELGFQYDERMKDVDYLEEQNKRYREVLSYVRELDCVDWNTEELVEMATNVLEGDSE